MGAYFVTGTDTGVGKTLVTAGLLVAAGRLGRRVVGLKPVAAGASPHEGRPVNEDALALQAAASVALGYEQVNPVLLQRPMAPHLAAAAEGRTIEVGRLARQCRDIAACPYDLVLAEGAGGWLVPLDERETMADLARELGWPVLLVVGMRLGCLNHALLSAESIRRHGLELAGWVANAVTPQMDALEGNIAALDARLGASRLGIVPWLGADALPSAAAVHLEPTVLLA
jgi:dethiobiotin synthetase